MRVMRMLFLGFSLLIIPMVAIADTYTVADHAFVSTSWSGEASLIMDFVGGIIGELPDGNTIHFEYAPFSLSLGYQLPTNSQITAAYLNVTRVNNLTASMAVGSTPLAPWDEFGCAAAPCPFVPATGNYGGASPTGGGVYVSIGDAELFIPPWMYEGVEFNGTGAKAHSETENFTYDLLELGLADELNASNLLYISGNNDLFTIRYITSPRGLGAYNYLFLDANRQQLFTATLNLEYAPVPEPAPATLLAMGVFGTLRGLRRRNPAGQR